MSFNMQAEISGRAGRVLIIIVTLKRELLIYLLIKICGSPVCSRSSWCHFRFDVWIENPVLLLGELFSFRKWRDNALSTLSDRVRVPWNWANFFVSRCAAPIRNATFIALLCHSSLSFSSPFLHVSFV